VILVEFNELTPRLMEQWMRAGELPNFQRFHREAHVYLTDAEEHGEELNPWIQWVTAHTGVSLARHGVRHLNETRELAYEQLWDVLSRAGHDVWVCGSMNCCYRPGLKGFLVPDPWSVGVTPHPAGEFDAYFEFVRKHVQGYASARSPVTAIEMARFGAFMARRGLSLDTVRSTLAQLWTERRTRASRWRRAAILDLLQWDIFSWYWRRYRPSFATFFLNSTAHFQHMYWRAMEPEHFAIRPTTAELADTGDAVLYGYRAMDRLLGRFIELAGRDATLVFVTGLSQQPYSKADDVGGRRVYRLNGADVLARLGVTGRCSYEPVMANELFLRFEHEQDAVAAAEVLVSCTVLGEPVFRLEHRTGSELFLQCRVRRAIPAGTLMALRGRPSVRYYDILHLAEGMKSGFHHPDGMLWIRQPDRAAQVHKRKLPLRAIAPGILRLLGVEPPSYMDCPSFATTHHDVAATPSCSDLQRPHEATLEQPLQ
jgi:hypothetical protein